MSRKKASMSLKDFHGGIIPSDLSLPSAPGVSTNVSGYDRPSSRVGSTGRPDQWVRPNSAPAARRFDDKTPFLGPTVPIGRHFDEDERKPLDGSPAPRRTVIDESFRVPPSKVEPKPEPVLGGRVSGMGGGPPPMNSYLGRVVEGGNSGLGSQNVAGNGAQVRGPANAWAVRKDPVVSDDESGQSNVASKLAHASALDKVLSGKWQTKQSLPYQTDAEVIDHVGIERIVGPGTNDEQKYHRVSGKDSDVILARQLERSMTVGEGMPAPRKEFADHDRAKASSYGQMKEWNLPVHVEKVQPPHMDGRFGVQAVPPPMQFDPSERPKLKLLPRTKPLESTEMPASDHKQGYNGQNDLSHAHIANTQELHGNGKPGFAGDVSENQLVDRPKLNLKPRSQPVEQSEGSNERERVALFGGARPREMVLKERGIDDAAVNNHDLTQQADRVKQNVPKTERAAQHASVAHPGERITDSSLINPKTGKKLERKDQMADNEKGDMQRKNWRSENWRNNRDIERQQQQRQPVQRERQQQPVQRERQPSPESWRKPAEPQKPTTHFGKTASALELTLAFSRSISDPRAADPYSGHKPGTNQMPFSRLMSPASRPQINGY